MAKQIVGLFNGNFEKIEFYEIMDNWKEYTVLRKQGTNEYYLYDNNLKAFTKSRFPIINVPKDKNEYEKLIQPECYRWVIDAIFFWADSKIVTNYGLPGYERIMELYKNLIDIRYSDFELQKQLFYARKESFFTWLFAKIRVKRLTYDQRKILRKVIKEYKIIW